VARAAVKAKQAQRAQAQAVAKPSRKQRKHASGGNPNQDLFFSRLRRKQKWVFLALAIVFAVSFTALGVGSGNGNDLEQSLINFFEGWFGGSDAVSQAQGEIKTDPAKGYKDLANAYVKKGDLPSAISALKSYLAIKKNDSTAWTQLASDEEQQAGTSYQQYLQVQQTAQLESPGSILQPTGSLAGALGTNPVDDYYSQQNSQVSGPLYQQVVTGYNAAVSDFEKAAKYAKPADLPEAEYLVARAAQTAGNTKVALKAYQRYVELVPNSPQLPQIEALCKQQLGGSCAPKHKKK